MFKWFSFILAGLAGYCLGASILHAFCKDARIEDSIIWALWAIFFILAASWR